MRSLRYPLALTILMLTLPVAALAGEGSWFDLEDCSMCKNMVAEEGLIEAMQWENHVTADGYMSITVVAGGHEDSFDRAMAAMQKTGEKMMAGEEMNLCGFCTSYGELYMAGATIENFETAGGHISLVSSRDPAVIEKIHVHAEKTIAEYEKMWGDEEHAEHSHDDHDKGHH